MAENLVLFRHFNIDWTLGLRIVKSFEHFDGSPETPLWTEFGVNSEGPVVVDPLTGSRQRADTIVQCDSSPRQQAALPPPMGE